MTRDEWDYLCNLWDKNELTAMQMQGLAPRYFQGQELANVLAEIDYIGETGEGWVSRVQRPQD